jgi:hypothetical protein
MTIMPAQPIFAPILLDVAILLLLALETNATLLVVMPPRDALLRLSTAMILMLVPQTLAVQVLVVNTPQSTAMITMLAPLILAVLPLDANMLISIAMIAMLALLIPVWRHLVAPTNK